MKNLIFMFLLILLLFVNFSYSSPIVSSVTLLAASNPSSQKNLPLTLFRFNSVGNSTNQTQLMDIAYVPSQIEAKFDSTTKSFHLIYENLYSNQTKLFQVIQIDPSGNTSAIVNVTSTQKNTNFENTNNNLEDDYDQILAVTYDSYSNKIVATLRGQAISNTNYLVLIEPQSGQVNVSHAINSTNINFNPTFIASNFNQTDSLLALGSQSKLCSLIFSTTDSDGVEKNVQCFPFKKLQSLDYYENDQLLINSPTSLLQYSAFTPNPQNNSQQLYNYPTQISPGDNSHPTAGLSYFDYTENCHLSLWWDSDHQSYALTVIDVQRKFMVDYLLLQNDANVLSDFRIIGFAVTYQDDSFKFWIIIVVVVGVIIGVVALIGLIYFLKKKREANYEKL